MPYIVLAFAIVSEVVATTALKASAQFTKPMPSIIVVVGYAISFYLLTRARISHQGRGDRWGFWLPARARDRKHSGDYG